MRLEDLATADLAGVAEGLDDIRHDLGKYIGFETRFLGSSPAEVDLRAALRADLLATRRHGDAVESAWGLWDRLRPPVLDGDPDVAAIDRAMAELQTVDLSGSLAELNRAVGLANTVSVATRRLAHRARQHLDST